MFLCGSVLIFISSIHFVLDCYLFNIIIVLSCIRFSNTVQCSVYTQIALCLSVYLVLMLIEQIKSRIAVIQKL